MTEQQKRHIKEIIAKCLRNKFSNYVPEGNAMPFHYRLLGKDRMVLYSFMQSLLTTFGTSIFEPVAQEIAKENFKRVEMQYNVGTEIYAACQQQIQSIINRLTYQPQPNKKNELEELRNCLHGTKNTLKAIKVDLLVETQAGEQYMFDLKTAKPNKGDFQKYKQTLLEWAGICYTNNAQAKVHSLIAIPYNPYEPKPYQSWQMAGMLDVNEELMVADTFWNFLGGNKGIYEELLDCFEEVGIQLRSEIDSYFEQFK